MRTYNILNLGAGVQSSTILLMMCRGMLPKPDCAIFADTGWEPPAVYEHLDWLKAEAERHDIPVHIVGERNIRDDAMIGKVAKAREKGERWVSMPYYKLADGDNREGQIRRSCTKDYKIEPIDRFVRRQILGLKPRQRVPKDVHICRWYGISADEATRARISPDRWQSNVYPLLLIADETLGRPWKRRDCIEWLEEQYPERLVPRSACIGCPYRTDDSWRFLRDHDVDSWLDAVAFDKAIRHCNGDMGEVFLHRQCVPLDEVDLRTDYDKGQLPLWENECEGMCGV